MGPVSAMPRLDRWDKILRASHMEWIDDAERIATSFLGSVTDVSIGLDGSSCVGEFYDIYNICIRCWNA